MWAINEKHGVVNVMFLVQFGENRMSENLRNSRSKRCMKQLVRFRIKTAYSQYCSSLSWITVSSIAM